MKKERRQSSSRFSLTKNRELQKLPALKGGRRLILIIPDYSQFKFAISAFALNAAGYISRCVKHKYTALKHSTRLALASSDKSDVNDNLKEYFIFEMFPPGGWGRFGCALQMHPS